MDKQIATVCGTIGKHNKGVQFTLSAPEQTPLGRIVAHLYYYTNILDCIDRNTVFGYPHNGGFHTFVYAGNAHDGVALLEMLSDAVRESPRRTLGNEERTVASQLAFVAQDILKLSATLRKSNRVVL